MKIRFTDNSVYLKFNPLTLTRPVCDLRFGINTIRESWEMLFRNHDIKIDSYFETASHLQIKYKNTDSPDLIIAGNCKPDKNLIQALINLNDGENLLSNGKWIASKGKPVNDVNTDIQVLWINEIWELFQKNDQALAIDFDLITEHRHSQQLSSTNQVINPNNIFLEEGAKIECAILNASNGPIYIGKNAEIMEGSMIRGPFTLGEGSTIKMGAKIYGATTVGPECKVGGEVSNCIIQGYSNKGHDGFIGNSIIGEWCNLGADTNSSNLKNNYGELKIYSYQSAQLEQTTNLFCGVLMGDHSKTGINTMLNTATTIGVSSNVFGAEFPPKYIPSFNWGTNSKFDFNKAMVVATNMMKRRGIQLSDEDKYIYQYIYDQDKPLA